MEVAQSRKIPRLIRLHLYVQLVLPPRQYRFSAMPENSSEGAISPSSRKFQAFQSQLFPALIRPEQQQTVK